MEIVKFEPLVVVVSLSEADAALLAYCIEPEAVLEPLATDGRYEAATAMQAAFQAIAEALRLQGRVVDVGNEARALRKAANGAGIGAAARGICEAAADDLAEIAGGLSDDRSGTL